MIRHILLVQLRPDVTPAEMAQLQEGLGSLLATLPQVRRATHGPALGLPGSSAAPADYAIALDFETPEDFQAYIQDPRHQAFVKERLVPLRTGGMSAQIRI